MNFKKNIIFVSLEFLNKSIPFFLISYYTKVLSVDDFSHIEKFNMVISLVTMLVMFSGNTYYQINFFKKNNYEYKATSFFMSIYNAAFLFFLFCVLYFLGYINNIIYLVMPFYALSFSFVLLTLVEYQMSSSIYRYSSLQIISTVLNFLISVCLLEYVFTNWEGRVWGVILPPIIIVLFLYKKIRILFKYKVKLKEIYIMGFSLFPHNILSGWLRDSVARLILLRYGESVILGYWSVTFNIAIVFNIVINALNLVVTPKIIEHVSKKKENIKILLAILLFYSFLGLVFSFIVPILFRLMVDNKFYYNELNLVLMMLSFSFALNGVCVQLSNILNVMGLSKYVSLSTVFSITSYGIWFVNNIAINNIANAYFVGYSVQFLTLLGIYICKRKSYFIVTR